MPEREFVPAAGISGLTVFYDRLIDIFSGERLLRRGMIEGVAADAPGRVLEVGCGTGSLTIALAQRLPGAEVVGVDIDPQALSIAHAKGGSERVQWLLGSATELPVEAGTFDVVAISLVMHHLMPEQQLPALTQALAALRPGGRLHVIDFGVPRGMLPRLGAPVLRSIDGRANTGPLFGGELPGMIDAAGFTGRRLLHRFGTPVGTLERFVATKAG